MVKTATSPDKLAAVTEEAARQAQIEKNQGLIQLINTWIEEDMKGDHEQQEREWQEFEKALDEDRFSLPDRILFS
ncbi:MAG: hypothetical protein ACR2M0_13590 [Chloroflexia bacterium]